MRLRIDWGWQGWRWHGRGERKVDEGWVVKLSVAQTTYVERDVRVVARVNLIHPGGEIRLVGVGDGDGVDHSAKVGVDALKESELAGPGRRNGGVGVRQGEDRRRLGGAIQNGVTVRDGYTVLAVGGDPCERRGRRDVERRQSNVVERGPDGHREQDRVEAVGGGLVRQWKGNHQLALCAIQSGGRTHVR